MEQHTPQGMFFADFATETNIPAPADAAEAAAFAAELPAATTDPVMVDDDPSVLDDTDPSPRGREGNGGRIRPHRVPPGDLCWTNVSHSHSKSL